jgi:hypothetical protein
MLFSLLTHSHLPSAKPGNQNYQNVYSLGKKYPAGNFSNEKDAIAFLSQVN